MIPNEPGFFPEKSVLHTTMASGRSLECSDAVREKQAGSFGYS
jgi:hypothetical protein